MWRCPDCGKEGIADEANVCPACGFSKRVFPTLSGSAGEWLLRTSLIFGSRNLGTLVGEADAVYAASRQFELSPADGEGWVIRAFPGTRNLTTLNDVVLTDEWVPLQDGDTIHITSKKDPSVKVAEIRVILIA